MIVRGIHLPEGDQHFAEQLGANPLYRGKGTYQWQKLEAALAHCERRGHAVDVGAHVGLWTRVLSYEFQKVTAFEPIAEYAECFKRNVGRRPGVKLHQFALDETTGTTRFSVSPDGVGTASISPDGDLEVERYTLDLVMDHAALDAEPPPPVDFLKIDCEGAELLVLRGGERTIRHDKPVVLVEQKPKRADFHGLKRMAAVDLLLSWGAEHLWEMKGDHLLKWTS